MLSCNGRTNKMVMVLAAASDVGGVLGASGTLGRRGFSGRACCSLIYFFPNSTPDYDFISLWMAENRKVRQRGLLACPFHQQNMPAVI